MLSQYSWHFSLLTLLMGPMRANLHSHHYPVTLSTIHSSFPVYSIGGMGCLQGWSSKWLTISFPAKLFLLFCPWWIKQWCWYLIPVPGGCGRSEWRMINWQDWVFGPSGSDIFPSLVLDEVALSNIWSGFFLDSYHNSCLKSKWQWWLGGVLHSFILCISCTLYWIARLYPSHPCSGCFQSRLL